MHLDADLGVGRGVLTSGQQGSDTLWRHGEQPTVRRFDEANVGRRRCGIDVISHDNLPGQVLSRRQLARNIPSNLPGQTAAVRHSLLVRNELDGEQRGHDIHG